MDTVEMHDKENNPWVNYVVDIGKIRQPTIANMAYLHSNNYVAISQEKQAIDYTSKLNNIKRKSENTINQLISRKEKEEADFLKLAGYDGDFKTFQKEFSEQYNEKIKSDNKLTPLNTFDKDAATDNLKKDLLDNITKATSKLNNPIQNTSIKELKNASLNKLNTIIRALRSVKDNNLQVIKILDGQGPMGKNLSIEQKNLYIKFASYLDAIEEIRNNHPDYKGDRKKKSVDINALLQDVKKAPINPERTISKIDISTKQSINARLGNVALSKLKEELDAEILKQLLSSDKVKNKDIFNVQQKGTTAYKAKDYSVRGTVKMDSVIEIDTNIVKTIDKKNKTPSLVGISSKLSGQNTIKIQSSNGLPTLSNYLKLYTGAANELGEILTQKEFQYAFLNEKYKDYTSNSERNEYDNFMGALEKAFAAIGYVWIGDNNKLSTMLKGEITNFEYQNIHFLILNNNIYRFSDMLRSLRDALFKENEKNYSVDYFNNSSINSKDKLEQEKDKIKEMYPARKKYYSDEFLNQSENLISNAIYSKTQFSFSLYKKIFK